MRNLYITTTSVICLAIAAAVLLSSSHIKDIATLSLPAVWLDVKKQTDDHQQMVKIATELHDHAEKSAKVQIDTTSHLADSRSLRLQDHKKDLPYRNRIALRLQLWWQLHSLHLS